MVIGMAKLNVPSEQYIEANSDRCNQIGVESVVHRLDEYDDRDYLKVNLPTDMQGFISGNGEGIWALPYSEEDRKLLDIPNSEVKVVVMNQCLYYPFDSGDVIKVNTNTTEFRPVLNKEFISGLLVNTGNTLEEYFKEV